MKRFLTKILAFVLIITSITAVMNFVYIIKLDKADADNTKKFQSIPSSIKICNFGSSHGLCGFNYEDVNEISCFNFGLSSQMLSYDKRLFDYYESNILEGAVVFIPVSYFSFFGNDERMGDWFAEKNKRYYRILPNEMIKDYDINTDIFVNYLPALSASALPASVNFIRVMLGKSEDTNGETWSGVPWSAVASDIDIQADAEAAYERHCVTDKFDKDGNRIINREEVEALKGLIEACYNNNLTPVLVTTPFLHEYTDEIKRNDPDLYKEFYTIVDSIIDGTGVVYYDYGFDDRFQENYNWFVNCDHLNKEGARQFVNILMDEVVHFQTPDSIVSEMGIRYIQSSSLS